MDEAREAKCAGLRCRDDLHHQNSKADTRNGAADKPAHRWLARRQERNGSHDEEHDGRLDEDEADEIAVDRRALPCLVVE